jgi:hypothetical protein
VRGPADILAWHEKAQKGQDTKEEKKPSRPLESYGSVPSNVFQFRLSSDCLLFEDLNGMEEKHVSAQAKRDHVRSEVE